MRKIQLDGKKIKQLRDGRDCRATQKEFAHEIGVSERRLRAIENEDAPVASVIADRIAHALKIPLQVLVAPDSSSAEPPPNPSPRRVEVLPRFDEIYLYPIADENDLFERTSRCRDLVSHIQTALTAETSGYAEELVSIMNSLTWDGGGLERRDSLEEIALRRRIRELLVLLKGNDVWVYADDHLKALPEDLAKERGRDHEFQMLIAFGPPPPDEFGSIKVPIDRGRSSMIAWGGGLPMESQFIDPGLSPKGDGSSE